jgi:hypothetical protein
MCLALHITTGLQVDDGFRHGLLADAEAARQGPDGHWAGEQVLKNEGVGKTDVGISIR